MNIQSHTYNRTKILMDNGQSYNLSNVTRTLDNLKANHIICTGANGLKYVVNVCNGFAYRVINS